MARLFSCIALIIFVPPASAQIIDRVDFDRTVDLVVAVIESLDNATATRLKSFAP